MKLIIILIFVGVSGCTTVYHHPDKSTAEFNSDVTNCRVKLGQANLQNSVYGDDFMENCMGQYGWLAE